MGVGVGVRVGVNVGVGVGVGVGTGVGVVVGVTGAASKSNVRSIATLPVAASIACRYSQLLNTVVRSSPVSSTTSVRITLTM